MLPGIWKEVVSKQSDLINAPHISVDHNWMLSNVQMNIASAKKKARFVDSFHSIQVFTDRM